MFEYLEKKKVLLVYIPLAVYWIVLIIGTSISNVRTPDVALGDKLVHLVAYFFLAVLLSLTLLYQNKYKLLKKSFFIFAVIIASVYGLLDEIHQLFVPGRYYDILDWVADSIGAMAGAAFIYFLLIKLGYFENKTREYTHN